MPDQTTALALHQLDERVLRSGDPQHYGLEECRRPDGPLEWDLVTRLPLRDGGDAVVGAIGVFHGTDGSQGAADLGTDGHDLLWLQGAGRTNPSGVFPTVSIMTAPFTNNPAQLRPRRLRSELGVNMGVEPFKVGCGYAALALSDGVRVVRLSDGVSWRLSSTGAAWQWVSPVALSCTELVAKVTIRPSDSGHGITGFARVRSDSLGPGAPPD